MTYTTKTTPAPGTVLPFDSIGGVDHPRTKLSVGAEGVAADVSAANPLPVTMSASDLAGLENVGVRPEVSGTPFSLNSAASTNATLVKNAGGTLFHIGASNAGAAPAYVKVYNKASAPTVGTDVPLFTLAIPAKGMDGYGFQFRGHPFTLGIAFAITNLEADTDTTAVAAAQVKVFGSYS